ncbi:MAG TPA: hypothetical protein EYQ50_25200 [Verrucomicrobiales bacterium]|nr:hypothetical protein [Verrucomicrobiales bacterium]
MQEKNKINTSAGSYETSEEELSNPLPVAEVVKFPENELPGSLTDPDVNFAKRRKFIEQAELFTGGCGESFATLSSPPMNNSEQPISPLKNYGCSPFFNGLYSETVYSNAAE